MKREFSTVEEEKDVHGHNNATGTIYHNAIYYSKLLLNNFV